MSKINYLKKHKTTGGKVYGSAVNRKRKRYCSDLKQGVAHTSKGEIATDNNGEVAVLSANQKAYRSGYCDGVSESVAAAKTSAGLDASRPLHPGVKLEADAVMAAFSVPGTDVGRIKK